MKGSLHTDEIMAAVVSSQGGLRTERRVSHVFVMDVPAYDRMLFVTDAAINIEPTLQGKGRHRAERDRPRAQPRRRDAQGCHPVGGGDGQSGHQLDASTPRRCARWPTAARSRGAILDGPLAFDNAISEFAARTKSIQSPVAGRADILLVPNIEAGNMLAKQLQYFAGADSAGIVLGARVPVILTSRADNVRMRIGSAAVAKLVVHARRAGGAAARMRSHGWSTDARSWC